MKQSGLTLWCAGAACSEEVAPHVLGRDVHVFGHAEAYPVEPLCRLLAVPEPVDADGAPLVKDGAEVGGVHVPVGVVEVLHVLVGYLLVEGEAVGMSRPDVALVLAAALGRDGEGVLI